VDAIRTLHFIETIGPGGAETMCLRLARGLVEAGSPATVAVRGGSWAEAAAREAGLRVEVVQSPRLRWSWFRRLHDVVRRQHIELVQTHLYGGALYGGLLAQLARLPAVCTFHGQSDIKDHERFAPLKWSCIRRGAAAMVFVSDALRRHFRGRGLVSANDGDVIPNGIDLSGFSPGRDDHLRRGWGIDPDDLLVGAIGNVRPAKAYETFVAVASRLVRGGLKCRFVIVGEPDPALVSDLMRQAGALGIADLITFAGYREDVGRVLNNFDVYLLTSRTEGFSLSVLQAMASGIPVVATRCGGPEEIIEDGVTGFLAGVGDEARLTELVRQLAGSPSLRAKVGAAAAAAVGGKYTASQMVQAYLALYERVVSQV